MPWLPLLWCWEEEDPGAFEYVISLRHVVPCTTVVVPLPHPSLGLLNTSARGASAGFPLVMPSAAKRAARARIAGETVLVSHTRFVLPQARGILAEGLKVAPY